MSEYWKSTPKYWCKHCATHVRDTPLERRNHEATGKHQGAVQRSLRNIHKEHEKEEREKARAKAEVERLNGVVGRRTGIKDTGVRVGRSEKTVVREGQGVRVEERKRQMRQLAEMGVAVPAEFRGDMAMAGEWSTVSTRPVGVKREAEEKKPDLEGLNVGVRKRKLEGEEEEEVKEAVKSKRLGWGKDLREYPGQNGNAGEEDIEALLSAGAERRPKIEEPQDEDTSPVKRESSGEEETQPDPARISWTESVNTDVKSEEPNIAAPPVFRKRKPKAAKMSCETE